MRNFYLMWDTHLQLFKARLWIFSSLLFILMSTATLSHGQSNRDGVSTYTNPILPGSHPDQTLLKVGNDFYTAGSSFHWAPNLPILHSTDLVHWEVISNVVSPSWSGLVGEDSPKAGTWQGALAYFDNKYWAYFFIHGKGQYFSNATDPRGPWSTPTLVRGSIGYDNAVFVDDDGRAYLLMKNGPDLNRIQELGTDGQLTGPVLNMDWVNRDRRFSWAEGPKMVKRNGRYYYFVAGHVYGGQYVLSSPTLTANESSWTIHGDFFRGTASGGFTGPNHITAPIQISDGTWWCMGHSYHNNGWEGQGRQSMLFQVFWDANGVPYANNPTGSPLTAPNLPSNGKNYKYVKSDSFNSTIRNPHWHFHNTSNVQRASLAARPGYLRLSPGSGTTHILQRDPAKQYSLVTKVEINAITNGQQAGLRMMNGEDLLHATLYSGYNNGKKIGLAFDGVVTEVNNTIGNTVWLKIERNLHNISGFYSADGVSWTRIGNPVNISTLDRQQTNDNAWVGTSVGLYATARAADFDLFSYQHGFDAISAAAYNNFNNTNIVSGGTGQVVTNTATNGWCMLAGVTMESEGRTASTLEVNAASANSNGTLEVWIDNIGSAGRRIASIPITSSGGSNVFRNYTANVSVSGQHDLYLRFVGPANVFRVNSVRFTGSTQNPDPRPAIGLAHCKEKYLGNIIANNVRSDFNNYWNSVTAENGCKWGSIEGVRNQMNWTVADRAYNHAKEHGLPFRWHAFAWGSQYPSWVTSLSPAEFRHELEEFIRLVSERYPDGIDQIDVVNEALRTHASGTPYFRNALGGAGESGYDWIVWCFQTARKYFPNSKLVLNDYGLENDHSAIREMLDIVRVLKERNLIDGFGTQAHHFNINNLSAAQLRASLDLMATGGIPIYVTELDITGDDATQRDRYARLFPVFWEHPAVAGITLWGYVEGQTWQATTGLLRSDGTDRPSMTWLKSYMAAQPNVSGCGEACTPTAIVPYTQINGGVWAQASTANLNAGGSVRFGPQPTTGGSWSWSGPNNYSATTREITLNNIQANHAGNYVATYTNAGGCTSSNTFVVTINQAPTVSLTAPANNATFTAPASITITATASDADGTVSSVAFYNGNTLLGTDVTAPYSFTWNNVAAGTYTISARATDNNGAVTNSAPRTIVVNAACTPTAIVPYVQINGGTWVQTSTASLNAGGSVRFGPQPTTGGSWSWSGPGNYSATTREITLSSIQTTQAGNYIATFTNAGGCSSTNTFVVTVNPLPVNQPPTVSLTGPANNATFTAPAIITLTATASDADGSVSSVAFFNGNTLLGTDATAPYSFTWNNVAAGTYTITARATDNSGATTTSAARTVIVNPVVVDPVPVGDILGPDCGNINSSIAFELNPALRAGATSYTWWMNGYSQSVTQVSGSPFRVNVETGQYFTNADICVGVSYNISPWYASYCKPIATCLEQTMAASAHIEAAVVGPNPSQESFTLTVPEAVHSVRVTNINGNVVYNHGNMAAGESITYGQNFTIGLYAVTIVYTSGRVETTRIQKL
ncbi:MAG: endo-1,4-beta-xylanase [Cytophagaceae bacterium]